MKNKEIVIENWYDLDHLCELMDEYGDSEFPFSGENENGETILISIFPDKIVLETFQDNGWTRINHYHRDGMIEELYEH